MQAGIDAQMRSHLDSLALTNAPMVGIDATRIPRGAKFEVKPGKAWMFNGNPNEIVYPFKFGQTDGMSMQTSKEFERMLLMATGTLDSQGMISQGSRDAGGLAPAVSGIIKKYKITLLNFQEDFLIPFIYKAAWRYMQFDPERYPSVDVKFIPTATLGIIAREYEQQQIAFMIQTLGSNSPLAPVLMKGMLKNSGLSTREQMIAQLEEMTKPDPKAQEAALQKEQMASQLIQSQIISEQAKAEEYKASAQKLAVEAQFVPQEINSEIAKVEKQMQLEAQKAESQRIQEQIRSTNDVQIEREQAINDKEVAQFRAELDYQKDQQKLELDKWKAELEAETKLTIAQMNRTPAEETPVIDSFMSILQEKLEEFSEKLEKPRSLNIERDSEGKAISVNGQPIKRDKQGRLIGV